MRSPYHSSILLTIAGIARCHTLLTLFTATTISPALAARHHKKDVVTQVNSDNNGASSDMVPAHAFEDLVEEPSGRLSFPGVPGGGNTANGPAMPLKPPGGGHVRPPARPPTTSLSLPKTRRPPWAPSLPIAFPFRQWSWKLPFQRPAPRPPEQEEHKSPAPQYVERNGTSIRVQDVEVDGSLGFWDALLSDDTADASSDDWRHEQTFWYKMVDVAEKMKVAASDWGHRISELEVEGSSAEKIQAAHSHFAQLQEQLDTVQNMADDLQAIQNELEEAEANRGAQVNELLELQDDEVSVLETQLVDFAKEVDGAVIVDVDGAVLDMGSRKAIEDVAAGKLDNENLDLFLSLLVQTPIEHGLFDRAHAFISRLYDVRARLGQLEQDAQKSTTLLEAAEVQMQTAVRGLEERLGRLEEELQAV